MERTDSVTVSAPPGDQQADVLLSDITARANRLQEAEDDERYQTKLILNQCGGLKIATSFRYQEEQRALGNGDVSPKKAPGGVNESSTEALPAGLSSKINGSRCDQLKNEISSAKGIESYPNNVAANNSVNS